MKTTASQRLLEMALPPDASIAESFNAVRLHVKRGMLDVIVTVPKDCREWFVDATDTASGARIQDWCDYDGYDSSSDESRDLAMAEDVSRFVEHLFGRELRLDAGRRGKLLWNVSNTWRQAVPFDGSAA